MSAATLTLVILKQEIAVNKKPEHVEEQTGDYTHEQLQASRLDTQQNLPDLSKAKRHFVPLNIEYWTPEKEGEEKLVYIHSVGLHEVPDMETGEIKQLECVMMLERSGDMVKRYLNAGRVLVGNIKDAIHRGEIVPGTTLTPVAIIYLGKRPNKSNAKVSNAWQIMPIIASGSEG